MPVFVHLFCHCTPNCFTPSVIFRPTVAGIQGNESIGCYSIALSGGYEDDIDFGDSFTFTGSGKELFASLFIRNSSKFPSNIKQHQ